ncbi:protein hook homolog [Ctenocephalides felis]|uniref:protein hook homolog n=1 Tax=Ctenocephalides felis TaxID=7515 RepID=UPI000E6E372F|nr:protein hook homolog [Ctenocephalides felis]
MTSNASNALVSEHLNGSTEALLEEKIIYPSLRNSQPPSVDALSDTKSRYRIINYRPGGPYGVGKDTSRRSSQNLFSDKDVPKAWESKDTVTIYEGLNSVNISCTEDDLPISITTNSCLLLPKMSYEANEIGTTISGSNFQIDSNNNRANTETWIKLTASLKDYYESQIKILEDTVSSLANENKQLKDEIIAVQDDFVNQQFDSAEQVNNLTTDIMKLREVLKGKHEDLKNGWDNTLKRLTSKVDVLQENTNNVKNNLGGMMNLIKMIAAKEGAKIKNINSRNVLAIYKKSAKTSRKTRKRRFNIKSSQLHNYKFILSDYKKLLNGKIQEIQMLNQETGIIRKELSEVKAINNELTCLNLNDKLDVLENYVKKVNRDKAKKLRLFARRVRQLEDVISSQKNNMHMRLALQQSQLTVKLFGQHQKEIERTVAELEAKYRGYFNEMKDFMDEQSEIDNRKIKQLKSEIERLKNIPSPKTV